MRGGLRLDLVPDAGAERLLIFPGEKGGECGRCPGVVARLLLLAAFFVAPPCLPCGEEVRDEGEKTAHLDRLVSESIELASSRLVLRTPRAEDLPALLPTFADYETVKFTWFAFDEGTVRWTPETLRERFEWQAKEQLAGKRQDFVMQLREPPHPVIGRCALYPWKDAKGDWELGITIHRSFWGNGYGEETTRAMLKHAFASLGAKEVRLRILEENRAMIRVCERIGIPKVLDRKDDTPEEPFFHHYHHYAITKAEWEAGQGR